MRLNYAINNTGLPHMDFLDPSKKRTHTIRLFAGYFLVGTAIALASLVLLFQSFGYDVDRRTGKVIQNGLIFLSAHPESADIYLNGEHKGTTDARLAVPAAQYSVELKREGYRPWKHVVNLEGGGIERLVYPILFPSKLKTADVQLYGGQPAFMTQSPDRHWLLLQQPGNLAAYDVFDDNKPEQAPSVVKLPDGLLTASNSPQAINLVEWSSDNRHVLFQHVYGDQQEFIMLDREDPAASFNIGKLFAAAPTKVTLRDKAYDKLYIYNANNQLLQTGDVKAKQLQPLLEHVLAYKTHGASTILYVSDTAKDPGQSLLKIHDGNQDYTLRSFIKDEYVLNIARFDSHWYVAAGAKKEGRVQVYRDPMDNLKSKPKEQLSAYSVLKIDNPMFVSFSDNARFIAAQSGNKLAVFDAETIRRSYYTLPFEVPLPQEITWMDGHRLVLVAGGVVEVFDFDGTNRQTLSPAAPGTQPFFDRDYVGLYSLAPSSVVPNKPALTRTELKVK